MNTHDARKTLTRFTPSEWIGRLIVVITLTALLSVGAHHGVWINAYFLFLPSLLGSSLFVILLAWRSYYSLVALGYVILCHALMRLYFLSVASCCGAGGGVSDRVAFLACAPPVLAMGYGLWQALPGRKDRKMGRLAVVLTVIGCLAAAAPVDMGDLLRLSPFAAIYWLARALVLRSALEARPA
jgi:hypothetical protein